MIWGGRAWGGWRFRSVVLGQGAKQLLEIVELLGGGDMAAKEYQAFSLRQNMALKRYFGGLAKDFCQELAGVSAAHGLMAKGGAN